MEFILISDDRLKIILSSRDLEEFNIRADELDYSNTDTKRMFWDILGRAKRSVGFSCDGERVMVRLYTSRDGGCEMFVSKLGKADDGGYAPEIDMECPAEAYRGEIKKRMGVFRFDRLEWLLAVCRRLSELGYSGKSSAYFDKNRSYYLFLDGLDATGYFKIDELTFINEFGHEEDPERALGFLCEHGNEICGERAVETLSLL